ncbi:MAG: ATP-binding protein [Gemmatimonadaceae bacterium]
MSPGRDARWGLAAAVAIAFVASLGGVISLAAIANVPNLVLWLVAMTVVAVGIGAGTIAYRIRQSAVDPIASLARAATAAASGDFSHPASETGNEDHRDIAHAINRMAADLRAERHQRHQLEKMADAGRIAAGIAHELGNPLTAIGSSIELLRLSTLSTAEHGALLDRMDQEVARAGRITNGLIDVSRPRTISAVKVDVNDAVRGAMRLLTDQGVMRRHRSTLFLDSTNPSVLGNRHDLEQIFVNLLLNAVAATPPDGKIVIATNGMARAQVEQGIVRRTNDPPLKIMPRRDRVIVKSWLRRVRPPAQIISVVVTDSGSGIPREDWGRVFDSFFTTKAAGQGTGLGLAVVKSLVEGINGAIWVERSREGGAAFHMLFPVALTVSPALDAKPYPA